MATKKLKLMPAFESWFENSQVVDENGAPLVVYHGTKSDFTAFETGRPTKNYGFGSYETRREGIFFTPDRDFAEEFAGKEGWVIDAYLSVQKLLDLSEGYPNSFYMKHHGMLAANNLICMRPEEMWEMLDDGFPGSEEFIAAIKADGYDGLRMVERNAQGYAKDVYVAFNATQIKSAAGNVPASDPKYGPHDVDRVDEWPAPSVVRPRP